MHNPSEEHMNAMIRILRYLKSSPGKGLMFSKITTWMLRDTRMQIGQGVF
jgi:hypothetical protein